MVFSQDSIPEPDWDNAITLFEYEPSRNLRDGILQQYADSPLSEQSTLKSLVTEQRCYRCPSDGYIKSNSTDWPHDSLKTTTDSFFVSLVDDKMNINHIHLHDFIYQGGALNVSTFIPVKKGQRVALGIQFSGRTLPQWCKVQFIPIKLKNIY